MEFVCHVWQNIVAKVVEYKQKPRIPKNTDALMTRVAGHLPGEYDLQGEWFSLDFLFDRLLTGATA